MSVHEWDDSSAVGSFWERQAQTVLVTGAYSHAGFRLVERLNSSGWIVRVLTPAGQAGTVPFSKRVIECEGSMLDPQSLVEALRGCQRVIHMDELQVSRSIDELRKINVEQTRALIQASKLAKVSQFVLVSTAQVGYRNFTKYGRTKKVAEDVLRGSSLNWTIVRPTLMVGVFGSSEFRWLRRMVCRFRLLLLPLQGEVVKRPVHEDDLAEGLDLLLRAAPAAVNRKLYHLAGRKAMTVAELVDLIAGEYQLNERLVLGVPLWVAHLGAKILNRVLPRVPFDFFDVLRCLQEDYDPEIESAVADFGYRPRPLAGRLTHEEDLKAQPAPLPESSMADERPVQRPVLRGLSLSRRTR